MKKPKLRELKEALTAVVSYVRGRRFTTKYPFEPHTPPEGFRGKPEFDDEACIGCGACFEVCPAMAISVYDDTHADPPTRTLEQRWDKCVFCGQCELNCTTKTGIRLTPEFELATFDRSQCVQTIEHELVMCEACGATIATGKHLRWIAEQIGAKAYANPTLIVTSDGSMAMAREDSGRGDEPALARNDMMRVLCPACRRTTVVRELWGE